MAMVQNGDQEGAATFDPTNALSRNTSQKPRRELGSIVTLVASPKANPNAKTAGALTAERRTVAAGTAAKVILLRDLISSKNRVGDSFSGTPRRTGSAGFEDHDS